MQADGMAIACKHCRELIGGKVKCSTCNKTLACQCPECHNETAHGIISTRSVHFFGGHLRGVATTNLNYLTAELIVHKW